jgi:hypothetical protein
MPYLTRIFFSGRFRVRKQTVRCQTSSKKFWPNLFLERWLKGVSWCLRRNPAGFGGVGLECPRGSRSEVCVGGVYGPLRFSCP